MGEITKGILIGAGGIILAALITQLFRKFFRNDGPQLYADVAAVPFDAPWQLAAQFTGATQEKLENLGEPVESGPSHELRDLCRDVHQVAREYKRSIYGVGSELRRIDGAIRVSISNKGSQPVEDVFLRIPGALYYQISDGPVEKIETETARDPAIGIGTLAQGHDVRVLVWTFMDNTTYGWNWLDDITLGHRNGVGTLHGFKVIRSRTLTRAMRFLDKHALFTGFLILILFICASFVILSFVYATLHVFGIQVR